MEIVLKEHDMLFILNNPNFSSDDQYAMLVMIVLPHGWLAVTTPHLWFSLKKLSEVICPLQGLLKDEWLKQRYRILIQCQNY